MTVPIPVQFTVQIRLEDNDAEYLDQITTQLQNELAEMPVESVRRIGAAQGPKGAKGEANVLGALSISVLPDELPKIIQYCQEWAEREPGRRVDYKGNIDGKDVEFSGTLEELQRFLRSLLPPADTAPASPPA